MRKSTRGRKAGKKGVKGKKTNLGASTASTATQPETVGEVPDEVEEVKEEVPSPPSETTADPDVDPETNNTEQPETETTSLHINVPAASQTMINGPTSPLPTATPKVIASLRKDTTGKRSTSNKENVEPATLVPSRVTSLTPLSASHYDTLEAAVVHAATASSDDLADVSVASPPAAVNAPSPSSLQPANEAVASSPKPADPIVAMNDLDEAVDKVAAEVPSVQVSPAKPKTKKVAPVVRTTKASLARLSLAQADKNGAPKAPAAGRPRPSTTLGRAGSVRQSTVSKPEPSTRRVVSTSNKRVPSTSNKQAAEPEAKAEKKETVIPHSKPRPVSLSFPTPPPPPKSKKAPTSSTFQLPGEAIAAKLKAAREERMKKEAADEEQKKAAFKARPVPAGLKKAPSVRQTTASKARESIMNGKPVAPTAGVKRTSSTATSSTSAPKPRIASRETLASSINKSKPAPDTLKVAKRTSTAVANTSKPRVSLTISAPTVASGTGQRVPSKGTSKGKEVFSRAAQAKEAAEKEKREKEEAAKKARAAASERGRQASRDWAEKQRLKKLGLKPEMARPAPAETMEVKVKISVPETESADFEATVGLITEGETAEASA